MLKGQFSRVSWSGSSWMPFTFQPALGCFSSPTTVTLTPASYSHSTSTSLHSIGFINFFRFVFQFQEDFFKVPRGHIKVPSGSLKGR